MFRVTQSTGLTRRSFVQAGLLGLGGLGLADFFRLRAGAQQPRQGATAVILFWLSGGPGHMETWDPKPDAPAEYRGPLGSVATNIPGVRFGELLPRQAALMDRLAIVRMVNHGFGDHTKSNHWMLTGFEGPAFNAPDFRHQKRPSLGSAVARLRGPNVPGLPPYVAVPHLRGGTDNFFHYAAYLGGGYDPFVVESDPNLPTFRVRNLALPPSMTFEGLESRRYLLEAVDGVRCAGERPVADMGAHYQRAFDLLTSSRVLTAFAIDQESATIRDRYGRHTFGQSALLARRLVDAGVTFVTVNCVPWDHHGTPPQLRTEEGARLLLPHLDRAIASLVDDLVQRGLSDRVLVVAMGEFGRTPRMNASACRDHWGNTFSVLFAGGGLRMGQVIGRSSARGETVVDRPVTPQDVAATVYHHLGIDGVSEAFPDHQGRALPLVESGQVIRELVG